MKIMKIFLPVVFLVFASCTGNHSPHVASNQYMPPDSLFESYFREQLANEFIDAFYSFDADRLKQVMPGATESLPAILYYQEWAACGNYEIVERHECFLKKDSIVICPVTVKDDLIGALNIDFNVTDTFHVAFNQGEILSVRTSSNDPELYYDAKEWVRVNRPELIKEPCEGILESGPTPCECVRAMIQGFKEFMSEI